MDTKYVILTFSGRKFCIESERETEMEKITERRKLRGSHTAKLSRARRSYVERKKLEGAGRNELRTKLRVKML